MHNPAFYDLFSLKSESLEKKQQFFLEYSKDCENVLEFGSGTGNIALPIALQNCNVTCVEPSETVYNILLTKVIQNPLLKERVTILPYFAQKIKTINQFDLVIAPNLFPLIPEEDQRLEILLAAKRNLNPKGIFICTFFSKNMYANKEKKLTGEQYIGERHYKQYTEYKIENHEDNNIFSVEWTFEIATNGIQDDSCYERFLCSCDTIDEVRSLMKRTGFKIVNEFSNYDKATYEEEKNDGQIIIIAKHDS